MPEIDPYATPEAEPAPASLPEPTAGVMDPTKLGQWSIGLLLVATGFDLIEHLRLSFGQVSEEVGVSSGSGLVYLACLVVFLCWSHRVLSNCRRIDPEIQTVSPGWGVGSYFVPIVQFWVPAKALMQASRISGTSIGLVLIWWVASLALLVAAVVYLVWLLNSPLALEDPVGVTLFDHFVIVADLGIVVAEVLMILGFNRVHRDWASGGAVPVA